MIRRPQSVRDRVVSVGDGPLLSNKLSKAWRVHVWQNNSEKNGFHFQLLIGLIPSHKESPNFWHVISQLWTNLYWNNIVPDRQGSAAHEILNYWISPSLCDISYVILGKFRWFFPDIFCKNFHGKFPKRRILSLVFSIFQKNYLKKIPTGLWSYRQSCLWNRYWIRLKRNWSRYRFKKHMLSKLK